MRSPVRFAGGREKFKKGNHEKIDLDAFLILAMFLAACDSGDDNQHAVSPTPFVAEKSANAKPVIWIGDFNNFDDAVALLLLAKDVNYQIKLIVVEDSFNSIAHGANMTYTILKWLGNRDVRVTRGAYFAKDEVRLGANGE